MCYAETMKEQWDRLSRLGGIWLAFALTFWLLLSLLLLDRPLLFHDWRYPLADMDRVSTYYTPWTRYVYYLGLPGLIAITMATFLGLVPWLLWPVVHDAQGPPLDIVLVPLLLLAPLSGIVLGVKAKGKDGICADND